MITITIDGRQIQTEPSKTIIEAAFENGIYIPHFCWHPAFTISGNCRMCLVEVEKMPKQVIACATRCMDGMVVSVNSEKAVKAREAVMEFILINHPLDCPICDEAGECKLQDYTYQYSVGESRFNEEKNRKPKRVPLGPHVMLDSERCIACSRCIRFCDEIVGVPQLTFVERGDRVAIETYPGKQLDNPYSMNVIEVCPVGALTSREFRFRSRVWDMASTDSVCAGCARGCNMHVWTRQNDILRLTPRENQNVNDFWMCDKGRLESFKHVNADTRVSQPRIRRDGVQTAISWDEAIAATASELRHLSGKNIAFIGSTSDTCEDLFLLSRFARELTANATVAFAPHEVPEDEDDFLLRADKTPNTFSARLLGMLPESGGKSLDTVIKGLNAKSISAVFIIDDEVGEYPGLLEALGNADLVIVAARNYGALTERADIVLAASTFAEKLGTFINFQGHLQLIRPSVVTTENERWMEGYTVSRLDKFGTEFDRWGRYKRRDCRPTWKMLANLARVLGGKWNYLQPEDVFEDFAASVPVLHGMKYETLGPRGVRIQGEPSAWKVPYVYSDVHP